MLTHFRNGILLVLAIILAACVPGQASTLVQFAATATPAQHQPVATAAEKEVTLVPASEVTAYPQAANTPAPQLQPMDDQGKETAIANLRALLGMPQLELAFKTFERSPNATNHAAVLFVDQNDNSYYISQETLQPIEFTIERPVNDTQGSPKTADELRSAAEQFAKAHSTRFVKIKDNLNYTEGIKSENNFFRWEMPGTDVGGMPAIFQVGFKQDGTLFSYLNSLDFLP